MCRNVLKPVPLVGNKQFFAFTKQSKQYGWLCSICIKKHSVKSCFSINYLIAKFLQKNSVNNQDLSEFH